VRDQTQNRVRGEKRLRAKDIAALPPGVHEDGGGLRLVVEPAKDKKPGPRRWVLRVTIAGKRHNRGLGPTAATEIDLFCGSESAANTPSRSCLGASADPQKADQVCAPA
jgi:hypothetical protein